MNSNSNKISFKNTLEQNPFHFSFPNRNQTMFLSTIKPSDIGYNTYQKTIHKFNFKTDDINLKKKQKPQRNSSSLITSDIDQLCIKNHSKFISYPFDRFKNNDLEGITSNAYKVK